MLKKIQNYLPPEIAIKPVFAGRLEDGRLFVVTNPQEVSDQSWRVYLGLKGSLKEYKATEVSVLRDGGTTFVKFAEGGFYFPSPLKEQEIPFLRLKNGEKIGIVEFYGPEHFKEKLEISKELKIPLRFHGKEVSITLK